MRSFWKTDTFFALLAIPLGTVLLGYVFWNYTATEQMWAIISFVLVYDPEMRTALSSGIDRFLYTLIGVAISLAAIWTCGVHRWVLPVSLAAAVLICGLALHFRNAWRVVLITICLIVGAAFIEPNASLQIAGMRAMEVTAGSVLAIIVSILTARVSGRTGKN